MDFEFDEHQNDLHEAVREILTKEVPSGVLRKVIDGDSTDALWQTYVSLDWPGLALDVAHGGSGATAVELAIVIEQLGYVADPTGFVATTTQFAPLVAACGNDAQRARLLGAVVSGGTATIALGAPSGRWNAETSPVSTRRTDAGWVLEGTACFVLDGDRADEIAVIARTDGSAGGSASSADGGDIDVFVVPGTAVTATRIETMDPTMHLADVCFDGVVVDEDRRLNGVDPSQRLAAVGRANDEALTGLAAMMVGACQRALDMVVDYVSQRHQFGVPVGSFQAVKHKAVDMHLAIERARALAYFAALTIAEDDDRRPLAAAMAKAAAGEAQRLVFQDCIQLFGGIGFTWENDIHLYVRRAKALELIFGGAADHRAVVGGLVMAAAFETSTGAAR